MNFHPNQASEVLVSVDPLHVKRDPSNKNLRRNLLNMEQNAFLARFGIRLPFLVLASWWILLRLTLRPPPPPSDPLIRSVSDAFQAQLPLILESHNDDEDEVNHLHKPTPMLEITRKGALQHDHKTLFWNRFGADFGSNPNTPYMYNTLPLFNNWIFPLLSPMWNIYDPKDAVVLIAREPPSCDYFSLTTFALWIADGRTGFPFASLGDSINHQNIAATETGGDSSEKRLFAHVVTSNLKTATLIKAALETSGVPKSAVHIVPIPKRNASSNSFLTPLGSSLWYPNGGTYFEVVMRLFRFENQTLGDQYLSSFPPVFYVKGHHDDDHNTLEDSTRYYKDRSHPETFNETEHLLSSFNAHGRNMLSRVGRALRRDISSTQSLSFNPLMIRGLDCLEEQTDCLGDCPDAAYFGPNIYEETDNISLLQLESHHLHVLTIVDHKAMNTSVYSSVAILKPPKYNQELLSKSHMNVRSTRIGVTSWDFEEQKHFKTRNDGTELQPFFSWAFSRNSLHCDRLLAASAVDGCTIVDTSDVPLGGYMTYCERIYLNPVTGLGPHWNTILSAQLYSIDLQQSPLVLPNRDEVLETNHGIKLPKPIPVKVFSDEPFRLLHIIKTGGESLQNYLDSVDSPRYSFQTCRSAAIKGVVNKNASTSCFWGASVVSSALCGLNCECCAKDIQLLNGEGFHGTLIRSPRAHALSLFTHGHAAHHTTYQRIMADVPLFLAEGLLRMTEQACGSYCTGSSPNWEVALKDRLLGVDPRSDTEVKRPLRVLPLENTQSHALTCSKVKGSLGHHFRVDAVDSLEPDLEDALSSVSKLEWVGITDLMEPSLCLLHFQANGSLPSVCDCNSSTRWATDYQPLGYWREYRYKSRSLDSLSLEILDHLDNHTKIDRKVFVHAVCLLLGRLKYVQDITGSDILSCIDWKKFHRGTKYIRELWEEELKCPMS